MHTVYLALAIVAEVIATSALKSTHEFTRFWPSLLVICGYVAAFYFLTLALRVFPVGVAYAVWSGMGIVLITAVGWVFYNQRLDSPALLGIGFIITGVLLINLFSKASAG
ncbi:DMT family transporter [Hydrocarboniclastica marina]|uniref:QacE family quaternary ammonium compound efflux SMR transporter n=1 Tax=Hydrocarboniclastica marina TaxID=2259620 RepID=A0A4P7XI01_9ALTE|nr:multidrug efflux SMR transporter [Hydrocarboniclastica marina]QCF26666.1 QacE family quaternary ammonium compound efflux SMR transporter [Hydrocarboniclastica marina]